jgi:hypothetical protein
MLMITKQIAANRRQNDAMVIGGGDSRFEHLAPCRQPRLGRGGGGSIGARCQIVPLSN